MGSKDDNRVLDTSSHDDGGRRPPFKLFGERRLSQHSPEGLSTSIGPTLHLIHTEYDNESNKRSLCTKTNVGRNRCSLTQSGQHLANMRANFG